MGEIRLGSITRRAALAAALVGASLAGAQAQTAADWDKVVAAAKAEGRVVLYTALVGDPTLKAIAKSFEAKYGVAVEMLEARASELRERTRTEQVAGRYLADVTFTSDGQAKLIDGEDKVFGRHEPSPASAGLMPPFQDTSLFAPVMTITYGMLINTNLVKPQDEPKSWADLADPKWKGKILSDDTRAIGGGYLWYFATYDKIGASFHEAVAKNEPQFTRDMREAAKRIARGEFPIYLPYIYTDLANLKGLPVKAIVPSEGSPYVIYGNVTMKNAPHPNAARLYVDYLMSEDAQLAWAKVGQGIVRGGLAEKIPAEVRAFAGAKLLGTTDPSRQDDMLEKAKKIYK